MFEIRDEGYHIYSIRINGKRVGSIWHNRDDSFTVKVDPQTWDAPFEISETESHAYSFDHTTVLRTLEPKVNKDG